MIPGIDTGGGGLSNSSSATSGVSGSDYFGGAQVGNFNVPARGIQPAHIALAIGAVAVAWFLFRKK